MAQIKFKGNPVTLVGRVLKKDAKAADFRLTSVNLKEVSLADFKQRIKVITTFLSLDTPVCDLQVKEFKQRATAFSSDVVVLAISKDLPFAQKRFCQANAINNLEVLSDYKTSSFGINYGLLIKEMNLLTRAVLILDKNDVLRYIQLVEELTTPPDYQDTLKSLTQIINSPGLPVKEELPSKCKPCEVGTLPLDRDKIDKMLAGKTGWQLIEDKRIVREFKFKDFVETKYFLDLVSVIAEEQGHHPSFTLIYNKLKISLTTHAAAGLTDNDFIMAKIIDELRSS